VKRNPPQKWQFPTGRGEVFRARGIIHRIGRKPWRVSFHAGCRDIMHHQHVNSATPDSGDQILLAHHLMTVADQKGQNVEHLRLDPN
jgi:hypothetical protein